MVKQLSYAEKKGMASLVYLGNHFSEMNSYSTNKFFPAKLLNSFRIREKGTNILGNSEKIGEI